MASDSPLLTGGQRKLAGFAVTLLALLATIALLALIIWVLGWLVGRFAGVLWPLAVAGILALILRPLVVVFETRLGLRRLPAVIVLYGLFLLLVAGLTLAVVPPLARQLQDFVAFLPTLWDRTLVFVEERYPDWKELIERYVGAAALQNLRDSLPNEVRSLAGQLLPSLRAAGSGILSVFEFLTGLAVIPI